MPARLRRFCLNSARGSHKAETERDHHYTTLDDIALTEKSRYFASNQYTDTLLRAICRCARYCNIRDSIIGKKRAAQYLGEFPGVRHSLYRLLSPAVMYIIALSPFLLRYLLPRWRRERAQLLNGRYYGDPIKICKYRDIRRFPSPSAESGSLINTRVRLCEKPITSNVHYVPRRLRTKREDDTSIVSGRNGTRITRSERPSRFSPPHRLFDRRYFEAAPLYSLLSLEQTRI